LVFIKLYTKNTAHMSGILYCGGGGYETPSKKVCKNASTKCSLL